MPSGCASRWRVCGTTSPGARSTTRPAVWRVLCWLWAACRATGWRLLAKNCAEWFISDLAIQLAGLISVPLYPLQAPEQIAYVLEHADCKVILVGKLDEPDKLATGIAPHIRRIAMPISDYANGA